MKTFLILVFLSIALVTIVFIYSPKCIESHTEIEHREKYSTVIMAGKVPVPITHPAKDVEVTICDKYEEK